MRKSILIGVLAALMLFAFTACEPQGNVWPADVAYITIEQVGEIVEGQAFDASDFNVIVTYSDKTTSIIPGNGVVEIAGTWGTDYKVTASLSVVGSTTAVTANYEAEVYEIEGIEVTVPENPVYSNDDLVSPYDGIKETLSVSVVYDGTKTLPLTASQYTLTDNGNKTMTVKETVVNEYSYTYEFEMPTPETPDTAVDHYVATLSDAEWYGDSVTVTINGVNKAGDVVSTLDAANYYIFDSTGAKVSSFATELGAAAVTYTVRTNATPYQNVSVTIPAGKNYISNTISELNVVVADGEKQWTAGDSLSQGDFKIEDVITYAIPDTDAATGEYVKFTVSEAGNVKLSEGNNTIHYQIQYCIKGVEGETEVKTLTINASPATVE